MGHEVTFASDINDPELLQATLLDLADRAAGDLRRKGYACRTVALKLRDERFRTFGGQRTLPDATSSTKVIYKTASALLGDLHAERLPAAPARPHPQRPHLRGPPARAR